MAGWLKDRRGLSTVFILLGIFIAFSSVIFLIVIGTFSVHMNEALDQNVTIGQVNLKTLNDQTFGQFNTMVINNADWWGLSIIFGMILGLFLTSYFARNKFPKITMILDLFFIFAAFLISLYLSSIYATIVNALNSAGENFAIVSLPKTSYFILNLPLFVVIIGVVMMILFHSSIPRKQEEINNIAGTIPT